MTLLGISPVAVGRWAGGHCKANVMNPLCMQSAMVRESVTLQARSTSPVPSAWTEEPVMAALVSHPKLAKQ